MHSFLPSTESFFVSRLSSHAGRKLKSQNLKLKSENFEVDSDNMQPTTYNLQPTTYNPQPSTYNPLHMHTSTPINVKVESLNLKVGTDTATPRHRDNFSLISHLSTLLTVFLLLISTSGWGQTTLDDFADENYTSSPIWTVHTGSPTITSSALTINNSIVRMSTPFTATVNRWTIDLRSSSTSNTVLLRYYFILKDNADPSNAASDGYYMEYSSTAGDVTLFRLDNGVSTSIGTYNGTATLSSNTTISISRDANNIFSLSVGGVPRISTTAQSSYPSSTVQYQAISTATAAAYTWTIDNITYGAIQYDMSSGNYTQDFSTITGASYPLNFNGVGVSSSGSIPSATNTTVNAGVLLALTSNSSIQINSATNIQFLATGTTNNTSSAACELYLNFTNRAAGSISFDVATVNNSTGNRNASLSLYYSLDNSTWTEITGTNLPYVATNNVVGSASVSVSLPSALNNQSSVVLRFYIHNRTGGTTGSRPKISLDNVSVTSSAVTPTLNAATLAGALTSTYGTASSGQSFTASGTNLSVNITATAQSGYEVSTSLGSGYGSSVSVASGTTVYVRFASTPNAGNYNSATAVVLSSTGASNVNVSTTSSGNTVSKATPTINTAPTASAITIGNALSTSILSGGSATPSGGTFSFTSPSTVPGSTGTYVADITYTPTDVTNYNTASGTVNVTVNSAASPVITAVILGSALSTTYGTASSGVSFTASGSNLSGNITATAQSGYQVSTSLGSGYGSSVSVSSGTTVYVRFAATQSAGTYNSVAAVVLSSSGASDANVSTSASSNTVSAKGLTITGIGILSPKTYDGTTTATITGTAAYSGLENGESFSISGTPSAVFSDKNVAAGKSVTVSGYTAPSANYSITQPTGLTADITAKSLSITSPSIASRAYNATTTAGGVTVGSLSGFVGSETVTATGSGAAYSSANVGTYPGVTVTYILANGTNGGLATNYSLAVGFASGTITAKTLTIGAPSIASKVYDGTTTAGAVTAGALSGLVGTETLTVSGAAANYSSVNVGSYASTAITYTLGNGTNGGVASNYSLANGSATGAITAKSLSITTATIADKVYNASATSGTVTPGTLSGFVGSETVTVSSATGTYADANAGNGKTATITYILANGTNGGLAANYSLASTTATGNITKATQTITFASIAAKTTADIPFNPGATASSGLTVSYSSSNTSVATVSGSTITIVGAGTTTITASQAGNGNYEAAASVDQTLTVTLAPSTILAWQFGSPESAGNETTYNSTTTISNVNTSTLERGSGITFSLAARSFSSTTFNSSTKNAAISSNEFFSFTVKSNTGYKISLSALNVKLRRSGTTGPNAYIWRYSLDGTNFTDIGTDVSFSGVTEGNTQSPLDLSGISALQNISSSTTITFRLYPWGASSTSSTFGIGRTTTGTTDDVLSVTGFVDVDNTPAITPSAASVSGMSYSEGAGPSAASSITLSATNLTAGGGTITVSGSTNFEVSTTSSTTGFGSTATLSYTGTGTLAANTVWIRLKAGLAAGTYSSETISITGGGGSTSVTASGTVAPPPPGNDLCSAATTASIGSNSGTTVAATLSSPFATGGTSDVWYSFTASCTATYSLSTSTTGQDLDIYVYGGSCGTPGTAVSTGGAGSTSTTSQTATFPGTSGTTYLIRVHHWSGTANSFTLTIADPYVAQAVTTTAATLVSGRAATLNGNLTTLGVCPSTTEKGFVYSLTSANSNPAVGGSGVTKVSVASIATGTFATAATGLTPSSGYSYKSYVYDGTTYTYGATQTFTTTVAANWDFGFDAPGSAAASYVPSANISLSAVSIGNSAAAVTMLGNLTTSTSYTGASGYYNAGNAASAGSLNTASNAYFEFTVTPTANYLFRLSSISFGSRSTNTGPAAYAIRSSIDSYGSDIATGVLSPATTPSWTLETNSGLNIISSLGSPVTFRIYGYNATGNTITNWKVDDIALSLSSFTPGAISTTGQSICSGGTPSQIGSSTAASGGDGSIAYSWRSSADGYTDAIAGETSATYTPPAGLTTPTSYRRYAADGSLFTTPTVSTGTWTVTIVAPPSTPTAGNNSRCGTGTVTISATPGSGQTIDWYSEETGGTLLLSGNSSYTTPSISSTTNYYAEARNTTTGCVSATRRTVTATVNGTQSITLTSGSNSQTPAFGAAITNIVYTLGGAAASVNLTGTLPTGVSGNLSGSTYTISGAPTQSGNFSYTVTTTPSNGCSASASGTITVAAAAPNTADYKTVANGLFSSVSTWEYYDGSTWQPALTAPPYPGGTNNIEVSNALTLDVNYTVGSDKLFELRTGGSLTINPGIRFSVEGTADFGDKDVVLKSTSVGTASIGKINGTLSRATKVTVERYLAARRKWRAVTVPLLGSTNNSIYYNWQNAGVNNGSGVIIWGPSGGDGLYTGGVSHSMLSYVSGTGWSPVTSTNSSLLFNGSTNNAYMLFATGPYNTTGAYITSGSAATTLKAKGTVRQGDITYTNQVGNGNFYMFGNPYPSAINLNELATRTGFTNFAYVWNPGLATIGGYETKSMNSSLTIESGQAFFLQANSASNELKFTEACKIVGSSNTYFRTSNTGSQISIDLNKLEGTVYNKYDNATCDFIPGENPGLDGNDALKPTQFNENMSIYRFTKDLSWETRPAINGNDTLQLRMWAMKTASYQMKFDMSDFQLPVGSTVVLQDAFLNTEKPISLTGTTLVNFTVNTNTAASSGQRFRVVFRVNTVTPVTNLNGEKGFSVYPNPLVKGNDMQLEFRNRVAGKYTVTLFTIAGVRVQQDIVAHAGGTAVQSLKLSSQLSSGTYIAEIMGVNGEREKVKVVVE